MRNRLAYVIVIVWFVVVVVIASARDPLAAFAHLDPQIEDGTCSPEVDTTTYQALRYLAAPIVLKPYAPTCLHYWPPEF